MSSSRLSARNNDKIKAKSRYKPQRRPPLRPRNKKFTICIGHFSGLCLLLLSNTLYLITYPLISKREAHDSSLKLQKHSLDSSQLHEHTRELERENALLREEIIVLRDHPDDQPHPDTLRLKELEIQYQRLKDQVGCVFPCIITTPFQLYFTVPQNNRSYPFPPHRRTHTCPKHLPKIPSRIRACIRTRIPDACTGGRRQTT